MTAEQPNRRRFLQSAAWLTAVAATSGLGGAWVAATWRAESEPPRALRREITAGSEVGQLAAAQAENQRLQDELVAAQRQIEQLRQQKSQPDPERAQLQAELETARERLAALGGLVALYDQLDGLELGERVEQGVGALAEIWDDLLAELPPLSEGLALGQTALTRFEAEVPLLDNGRRWLAEHVGQVEQVYALFGQRLEQAVTQAGPLLEMLERWFAEILNWLPFGMGRTAVQVMAALTDLVRETPKTIEGTTLNVRYPLEAWLVGESTEDEPPLVQKLVKPLREQALQPATRTLGKVQRAKATYDEALLAPLTAAVDDRRALREAIADYRREHGLAE